jgi:hypothetical protein
MNETLLRDIVTNGPGNREERLILAIMASQADNRRQVAISPAQIGNQCGLGERTVRHRLNRLIEEHWLKAISLNHWEINTTRAPARARNNQQPLDRNPNPSSDASWRHQGVERELLASQGEGQAKSLGLENCPRCGGTGWEEVESVKPGYFTVDVCHCRGGPDPVPTSVYPPREKRSGPHPEQIMRNLQGIELARSEMRNEDATEARTSPLPPRSVAQDSEANPGEG